jgi:hypothetical protein
MRVKAWSDVTLEHHAKHDEPKAAEFRESNMTCNCLSTLHDVKPCKIKRYLSNESRRTGKGISESS